MSKTENSESSSTTTSNASNITFKMPHPDDGLEDTSALQTSKDLKFLCGMVTHHFSGEPTQLELFLDQVYSAMQLCDPLLKIQLFHAILAKIEGEPKERIRENREEIFNYTTLKNFLLHHYRQKETYSTLASDLAHVRQERNERIQQYADRITHLAYKARLAAKTNDELPLKSANDNITFLMKERLRLGSQEHISRFLRTHKRLDFADLLAEAINYETEEIQEKQHSEKARKKRFCSVCKTETHDTEYCRFRTNHKKCTYCKRNGHEVNECRTKKFNDENHNDREQILAISCRYCKNDGHSIDECRKLKYKREQEAKDAESQPQPSSDPDPIRIATKKIQIAQHSDKTVIELKSKETRKNIHLVLDTGAAVSLIDYDCLNSDIQKKIDISKKILLTGITEEASESIGKVSLRIEISEKDYLLDFQVYRREQISIPFQGVLGHDIIKCAQAILDYQKHELYLKRFDISLPFLFQYELEENSKQIIMVQTRPSVDTGILPELNTPPQIRIEEAVVSQQDGKVPMVITNMSAQKSTILLPAQELQPVTQILTIQLENQQLTEERKNKLRELIDIDHLPKNQEDLLFKLILEFHSIFYLKGDKLISKITHFHEIQTKPSPPIYTKNYRFPEVHKEEVTRQVNELLKQGVVTASRSPWNSPIWIVPKKEDKSGVKKWRMVIDYRKLNDISFPDKFPIPQIDDIFDALGNARLFTTLDLASGFHQIPIHPRDRPKTAFSTHTGHYEFNRMPFGLANAPATFQRVMNYALSGTIGSECFVYLDDIIIYSSTFEQHLQKLRTIFRRLYDNHLLIQLDKTEFLKTEVAYLGHIISENGISPNPKKIKEILELPPPNDLKSVQRFLGMAGYYRRFIQNYSELSKPLSLLTHKNHEFQWTDEQQKSFERLKKEMTSDKLMLHFPDFTKEFALNTDASSYAIGAVLSQDERPIAFASRTLNSAEQNYSTIEKELLAIVWATKHFRPYLYGRKFLILSDHKPLVWLFNIKDPGSRLLRWRLKLNEYQYTIRHISGSKNIVADALSRILIIQPTSKDIAMENKYESDLRHIAQFVTKEEYPKLNLHEIEHIVYENRNYYLCCYRLNITSPYNSNDAIRVIETLRTLLLSQQISEIGIFDTLDSGTATVHRQRKTEKMIQRLFLPVRAYWALSDESNISHSELIRKIHFNPLLAHPGVNRVHMLLKDQGYYWSGMRREIQTIVSACDECKLQKISRQKILHKLQLTDTPTKPFEKIALDLMGPYPETKNHKKFIVILLDLFSKYVVLKSAETTEAIHVIRLLQEFIGQYSVPKSILTDQGNSFCNTVMKEFQEKLQINHCKCTPYHPQSNGSVERTIATIKESLKFYINVDRNDWDEHLYIASFAFNNNVHSSTQKTPHEVIFGTKPQIPNLLDANQQPEPLRKIHQDVEKRLIARKQRTIQQRNERDKRKTCLSYKPGDLVKIRARNTATSRGSLTPHFEGPYTVVDVKPPNLKIQKGNQKITYHMDNIMPYTILILTLLFLPFLGAERFITEISHHPGIYFNHEGIVGNYHSDWNFITYINLTEYQYELQKIENQLQKISTIEVEQDLPSTTQTFLQNIQHGRDILEDICSSAGKLTRRKRALGLALAVGASAISYVIGKVSGTDHDITNLQTNQHTIRDLLSRQIQVINNTAKTFELTSLKLVKNQEKIEESLKILINVTNENSQQLHTHYVEQRIEDNELRIHEIYSALLTNLLEIENAVLHARSHDLHPIIMKPKTLRHHLSLITLSNERILPITINELTPLSEVAKYYTLLKMHTQCDDGILYFSISVPLVENTKYNIFKLLPFPQASSVNRDLLLYIKPSFSYLLINQETTKYAFLDNLAQCLSITDIYHLCYLPIVNHNIDSPCEVQLYLTDRFTKCNVSTFFGRLDVWEPIRPNTWLFSTERHTSIRIYCNESVHQYSLPPTGLLQLPSTCFAQTNTKFFYPKHIFSSNFTTIIPAVNITDFEPTITAPRPISPPRIQRINQMEIIALTDQLREEQNILNTKFITNTHFHYSTIICFIIIFLCIFVYLYIKWNKTNPSINITCPQAILPENIPLKETEPLSPSPPPVPKTRTSTRNKKPTIFFRHED